MEYSNKKNQCPMCNSVNFLKLDKKQYKCKNCSYIWQFPLLDNKSDNQSSKNKNNYNLNKKEIKGKAEENKRKFKIFDLIKIKKSKKNRRKRRKKRYKKRFNN